MKRTLKRESEELEVVEREAIAVREGRAARRELPKGKTNTAPA
jgi:hypothetical protein